MSASMSASLGASAFASSAVVVVEVSFEPVSSLLLHANATSDRATRVAASSSDLPVRVVTVIQLLLWMGGLAGRTTVVTGEGEARQRR
ncbi:MAG: hypothetical protein V9E94_18775 [Microthrixaceae bacterium]